MSVGDWDVYAQCECGWRERAPFGSKFHVHKEVCPTCGEPKCTWDLVTGRYGDDGFEKKAVPQRPAPSGCLAVHSTTAALALLALGWWFT